jgi:hypothetical protein
LSDGLPNEVYDQALTLVFNIPKEWIGKTITQVRNDSLVQAFKFNCEKAMISVLPDEVKFSLGVKKY